MFRPGFRQPRKERNLEKPRELKFSNLAEKRRKAFNEILHQARVEAERDGTHSIDDVARELDRIIVAALR